MRPLTPEEIARARKLSTRQWRDLWFALFAFHALALLSIWGFHSIGVSWWVLVPVVLLAVLIFVGVLLRMSREWQREFQADIARGELDQRIVKIYDRWGARMFFFRMNTYTVMTDSLELLLDRSLLQDVRPGDTLQVDYLPRTHLVISAQKVASP